MSFLEDKPRATPMSFRYMPDPELLVAAKVAMELGQPLLLTGEPGTGKTTFAQYLATELAPDFFARRDGAIKQPYELFPFETKSTSLSTDLFYQFDSLRRFRDPPIPGAPGDNLKYITFEALGRAIILSWPWEKVSDLVADPADHPATPRRSVVLIDEIDKAPRDFPNDLLNEIQSNFFRVPELIDPVTKRIRRIHAAEGIEPIVILTSNSEKNLPAPFLRRCVFHHIRFPGRDQSQRLIDIIKANLTGETGALTTSAVSFFYDIREKLRLEKLPTTHELIQWIRTLRRQVWSNDPADISNTAIASLPRIQLKSTLCAIAKTEADRAAVEMLMDQLPTARD